MNAWLMKSEPDECSIDDALAAPEKIAAWTGVRNYQAHSIMRDAPRWVCVDVRALRKTRLMPLREMHAQATLKKMWALRPGYRLSITPVSGPEWKLICNRLA